MRENLDSARVLVLSLGGTIAMTSAVTGSGDTAVRPHLDADDLIDGLGPDLAARVAVTGKSFARVPSADLRLDDVVRLADTISNAVNGEFDGVVVTQGTDTIEEAAFALDLLLHTDAPVVVTGAMRNPSQPGPDGPANLSDAIAVASSPAARGMGTLVVFGGEIHGASLVRKTRAVALHAFESVTGTLGWVAEGAPHILVTRATRPNLPTTVTDEPIPAVALLRIGLGDDGRLLDAVQHLAYDGLVIDAMGAGHLPTSLVDQVQRIQRLMPVVLCSRTGRGSVLRHTYGFPGSEQDLLDRGLISGGYLDGLKARIALALMLRAHLGPDDIRRLFVESFAALP